MHDAQSPPELEAAPVGPAARGRAWLPIRVGPTLVLLLVGLTSLSCALRSTRGCIDEEDCTEEGTACIDGDCLFVLPESLDSAPPVMVDAGTPDALPPACEPADEVPVIEHQTRLFEISAALTSTFAPIRLSRVDDTHLVVWQLGGRGGGATAAFARARDGEIVGEVQSALALEGMTALVDAMPFRGLVRILWQAETGLHLNAVDDDGNGADVLLRPVVDPSLPNSTTNTEFVQVGGRQGFMWGEMRNGGSSRYNYLTWLANDGSAVEQSVDLLMLGRPDAVGGPDGFAVVLLSGPRVGLQRYDADGLQAGEMSTVWPTSSGIRCPTVLAAGEHYAVGWSGLESDTVRAHVGLVPRTAPGEAAPGEADTAVLARLENDRFTSCVLPAWDGERVLAGWADTARPVGAVEVDAHIALGWRLPDGRLGGPIRLTDDYDEIGSYAIDAHEGGFAIAWLGSSDGIVRVELLEGRFTCPDGP